MRPMAFVFLFALVVVSPQRVLAGDEDPPIVQFLVTVPPPATRPAALLPLYISLASLQAYDAYSTQVGHDRGVSESNPVMVGLAGHPAALWALKAGSTAYSIFMAEQLWKQGRRRRAIVMLAITTGIQGFVAAKNMSALSQAR